MDSTPPKLDKISDFETGIDQFIVVQVFGFLACVLMCLGRLLSHLIPHVGGAYGIRVVYSLECLVILPMAYKYRTVGPFVTLLVVATFFNPLFPLRLHDWELWQYVNVVGLVSIAVSLLKIYKKRTDLKRPFELEHIKWVHSLPDSEE